MAKKKILIVEDDSTVLEAERVMVESLGYQAICASCAESAMKIVRQQRFDAILLDIGLPGRDGYALAKKLKSIRSTETIPIAFVSGAIEPNKITQAFQSGGSIFLSKPFAATALKTTIEALLNKPIQAGSPEAIY